ncbi:ABC transporter ATP-binding protein [Streptomyces sp. NPDC092296]|uniref:ABC transporter ATP-binding protein n=1 Tax=Streptomyces sp. NPDC092296 TaxID=3366012 RepID=UPI003826F284
MTAPATGPAAPAEPAADSDRDLVLRAEDIHVEYDGERPTRAVRGVSFELRRGEVLGIAGESGCGKSTLAYAVTRMLKAPARMTRGSLGFRGRDGQEVDLLTLDDEGLRTFRWSSLSMVFQSAMNALNPVTSIGRQFDDIFRAHRPEMERGERDKRTRALLEMVGIDADRVHGYPHELSGGMRQRVVIAMALALEPDIVIMDEPTTALDVVVQREILDEVERLREELGFSVIFITHDLGLLLEISDRLAVMYAGEVIEYAPAEQLATAAAHPYTQGLLRSFPDLTGERRELRGIPGSPPDLRNDLVGCAFVDRCEHAFAPCRTETPRLLELGREIGPWTAACHLNDPAHRPPDQPGQDEGTPSAEGRQP